MLSVKIVILQLGQTTMMRFNRECSLMDVCKQIHQKYFGETGGADHAIFRPSVAGKGSGEWLKMERTLMHYSVENQVCSSLSPSIIPYLLSFRMSFITRRSIAR